MHVRSVHARPVFMHVLIVHARLVFMLEECRE
jgi:hypothetical protein